MLRLSAAIITVSHYIPRRPRKGFYRAMVSAQQWPFKTTNSTIRDFRRRSTILELTLMNYCLNEPKNSSRGFFVFAISFT